MHSSTTPTSCTPQSRARSLLLHSGSSQTVTQHVWTVGLFMPSLSFFCSFEEYSVTVQKVLEGRTAVHFMAPLSQLFFFLCLFSLCATISVVFKSKLSPLINLRQGNILYVRQLCSIATHMYFSHLVFYLSNWSDCRLQSP